MATSIPRLIALIAAMTLASCQSQQRRVADSAPILRPAEVVPIDFTITGLVRAGNGTWWAGNDGRSEEVRHEPYRPSLRHLSSDLTTTLSDWPLNLSASVQGVALVGARVWFAVPKERLIGSMPAGGAWRREAILGFEPNGIAFDPSSRSLIVGDDRGRELHRLDLTKKVIIQSAKIDYRPDQIAVTKEAGWISTGKNREDGYLVRIDLKSLQPISIWRLPGSLAIEGIAFSEEKLFVANDAKFHMAGDNDVRTYSPPG